MKGPFATMSEAYAVAKPGEAVMARDSAHNHEAGWCVMSMQEAVREFNALFSSWIIWEEIK